MALSLPPPPNTQSIADVDLKKDKDGKITEVTPKTNWSWASWFVLLQQKLNNLIPAGGAQAAIQFQDEGSNLGASGTVTAVNVVGANVVASRSGDTVTITESAQAPLQFQDEGVNLGTTGTVNTANFTGNNLTASRVGNALTVNVADQTIALTGDATGSGTTSIPVTFATVNATPGTFGSSTQVGQFTVNGKGLITAAANVTITPSGIGAQAAIQFRDEGVDLGTSGTVTAVDFTGAGVTATRSVNTLTVNIPSSSTDLGDVFAFAAAHG